MVAAPVVKVKVMSDVKMKVVVPAVKEKAAVPVKVDKKK